MILWRRLCMRSPPLTFIPFLACCALDLNPPPLTPTFRLELNPNSFTALRWANKSVNGTLCTFHFNRWSKSGVRQRIVAELMEFDLEELQGDSTVVPAHQHAARQKRRPVQLRSRTLTRRTTASVLYSLREPLLLPLAFSGP